MYFGDYIRDWGATNSLLKMCRRCWKIGKHCQFSSLLESWKQTMAWSLAFKLETSQANQVRRQPVGLYVERILWKRNMCGNADLQFPSLFLPLCWKVELLVLH